VSVKGLLMQEEIANEKLNMTRSQILEIWLHFCSA